MKNELYFSSRAIKIYSDEPNEYSINNFDLRTLIIDNSNNRKKCIVELAELQKELQKEFNKVSEIFSSYTKTLVSKYEVEADKILKKYE